MSKNKTNKIGTSIVLGIFILVACAMAANAASITFYGNITDGSGISQNNANISVYNASTDVFLGSTLSGADGLYTYTFDGDLNSLYNITATNSEVKTKQKYITTTGTYSVNFTMSAPAVQTINGTVYNSTGSSLSGVTVKATTASGSTMDTNTTVSGFYELTVLNNMNYIVNYTLEGYYSNTSAANIAGFNITKDMYMDKIPTTGTLNGTVKDQFNNPVENAIVYFKVSSTNSTNSSVLTNSNGYYTTNLAQKEYYIEVEKSPGYLGDSSGNIFLINGQTNTTDFTLTDISIISGTTTPAGVNVTFRKNGSDAYSLISNSATGAFTQTVEVGFYNITSSKSGYYNSDLFNANFTADVSGYSITLSAVPPPSSDGGSNTPNVVTGSDYEPETTALSYSYSFASVPANRATGMVFKNIGINQITFETMQELKNADFKLEKYDEKPAGLPDAPGAVYKFIKIDTKNVPGEVIKYVRFNFEASNSWISEKGINVESVKLYRLVDNKWTELSTKKTGQTSEAVYYEANSPGFSFFAIAAGTASAPEGQQPQQPVSGTGGDIIITPDGQTGTANGTAPPITGGAVGAAFKGKPMFTYIIIGLLVVAAIFAAVYYSRQSNKGLKRSKKGSRK